MSHQLQGLIESLPEYDMLLITEDFGVKLTEEITNQNASGRCKWKKNMDSPITAQRIIFFFGCFVSLLNLKFYMLASKEPYQSENVERQYVML